MQRILLFSCLFYLCGMDTVGALVRYTINNSTACHLEHFPVYSSSVFANRLRKVLLIDQETPAGSTTSDNSKGIAAGKQIYCKARCCKTLPD